MQTPERLYRYQSLEGDGLSHLRATIQQGDVFFADPTSFNDPFECRFSMSVDGTEGQWAEFLCRPDLLEFHGLPPGSRPTPAQKRMWRESLEGSVDELAEKYRAKLKRDVGVLCLAERNDNLLMWSHYADVHRGVCLGIAPDIDPLIAMELMKVSYQDEYPELKYHERNDGEWPGVTLATKSRQWEYEAEWRVVRVVRVGHGAGLHRLRPGALTDIILGSEIAENAAVQIREWVQVASMPPKLWNARRRPREYAIAIEPDTATAGDQTA